MMGRLQSKVNYWRRIFPAYLGKASSQLTFWHDHPKLNDLAFGAGLGEYYQDFSEKADYRGPYDGSGIPLLDYGGTIGKQYNPIAIAQYGLGNYNLYRRDKADERCHKFLRAADWLVTNIEVNAAGVPVWHHHFDWEYRSPLRAPWYSGLAQGQGISLLVRAFQETRDPRYLLASQNAFRVFTLGTHEGGVCYRDEAGNLWVEEYLVEPPSHILNGFLWASWGIYDYALLTEEEMAFHLFKQATETLAANLFRFDTGYWSLYELSPTRLPMLASPFYHRLHIAQLQAMYKLTGEPRFIEFARHWEQYEQDPFKRRRALLQKVLFKLLYY